MVPWVHLDSATVPGDEAGEGEVLRLMQRGFEYSIMAGATELMNSRLSGSEEALARLACAPIRDRKSARVLIGGLGMGFTLRAAQTELKADARITVAELVPAVTKWARGSLASVFEGSLDDARTDVYDGDVGALIREADAGWDSIILDVDNSPKGLSRKGNDSLYNAEGLAASKRALTPGGVLAVWSSVQDNDFTRRLRQAGFKVEEVGVRATRSGRGARHWVWVAKN
jgi:spermidine synthase